MGVILKESQIQMKVNFTDIMVYYRNIKFSVGELKINWFIQKSIFERGSEWDAYKLNSWQNLLFEQEMSIWKFILVDLTAALKKCNSNLDNHLWYLASFACYPLVPAWKEQI